MPENKLRRLDEVIPPFVLEGANDQRWFLIEHQLKQVKMSAQVAVGSLKLITDSPENEEEREIATDCLSIIKGMQLDILEHYAAFLSYVSGTDVPERISRKEL